MCKAIFILKELDLIGLAESFGLLKVPKMPELKNVCIEIDLPDSVDLEKIPYLDKVREKARLKRLQAGPIVDKSQKDKIRASQTVSWAKKKEQKMKKEKRKMKKIAVKSKENVD